MSESGASRLPVIRHSSAGAVVFRAGQVLLLRKSNGQWVFPKGHLEDGEEPAVAAEREILEEAGVKAVIGEPVGATAYTFRQSDGRHEHRKRVYWFRAEWIEGTPAPEDGLFDEACFVAPEQAARLLTFKEDREILVQSITPVTIEPESQAN